MLDHTKEIERWELLTLLEQHNQKLYNTLLDERCFTRSGKLNKSAAARLHGWKPTELDLARRRALDLLAPLDPQDYFPGI